ncbi:MAG: diacylglycerol kinase family lipid kinase [Brevinematales bacterium]|nr:diacylglycerol kinase family lipid kinase [Brevinematales bacterium]
MKKERICIVNPIAGNGFSESQVPILKTMLEKHKIPSKIVYTEKKGHATELAADFIKKGYKHILAMGGDGTFSEVAQALIGHPDVIFGPISAGTGNDFIQILGFSDHFTPEDWDTYFEENTIMMDAGNCNGHYFINGMGLGMDAQVAAENYRHEHRKPPSETAEVKKGGKKKYIWHIVKTLLFYREKIADIIYDGNNETRSIFLNSIGMGRRMAGSMYLTPRSFANDGLMDICMIRKLGIFGRLGALSRVQKQTHLDAPYVKYIQTAKISYEFNQEVPSHLDGELYFNKNFDIKVMPAAIKIIYNPKGKHFFKV